MDYGFVVHNLQTKISGKLLLRLHFLMVTILHRELQRKVEKVKHMKLEVMQQKTKNNMNFWPELNHNWSVHVNCQFFCEE